MLLTATLCLLAFGAVMVYSASSARDLLQGHGDGTGYLVRYLSYGAPRPASAMHVVSRRGLDRVAAAHDAAARWSRSSACSPCWSPASASTVNGARRWLGAGPLQFQPSELAKLALVLYAAKVLAKRPGAIRSPRDVAPLLLVAGAAMLPRRRRSPTSAPRS